MSAMTDHGITKELKDAARVMSDTGTFETGQGIMLDAAKEIERLRDELVNMHQNRLYVMGFNAGWDAAMGEAEDNSEEPPHPNAGREE